MYLGVPRWLILASIISSPRFLEDATYFSQNAPSPSVPSFSLVLALCVASSFSKFLKCSRPTLNSITASSITSRGMIASASDMRCRSVSSSTDSGCKSCQESVELNGEKVASRFKFSPLDFAVVSVDSVAVPSACPRLADVMRLALLEAILEARCALEEVLATCFPLVILESETERTRSDPRAGVRRAMGVGVARPALYDSSSVTRSIISGVLWHRFPALLTAIGVDYSLSRLFVFDRDGVDGALSF